MIRHTVYKPNYRQCVLITWTTAVATTAVKYIATVDSTRNVGQCPTWWPPCRIGRWHPLFNAAKFGWRPLLECCAVTLPRRETRWNLQGCPKLANKSQPLVGRSSPYYQDTWRRYWCLTSFFWLSIHIGATPCVEVYGRHPSCGRWD